MSGRKIGKGLGLIRLVAFPADCLDNEINLLDPNRDRLEYKSPGEKKEQSLWASHRKSKCVLSEEEASPLQSQWCSDAALTKIFPIWKMVRFGGLFTQHSTLRTAPGGESEGALLPQV